MSRRQSTANVPVIQVDIDMPQHALGFGFWNSVRATVNGHSKGAQEVWDAIHTKIKSLHTNSEKKLLVGNVGAFYADATALVELLNRYHAMVQKDFTEHIQKTQPPYAQIADPSNHAASAGIPTATAPTAPFQPPPIAKFANHGASNSAVIPTAVVSGTPAPSRSLFHSVPSAHVEALQKKGSQTVRSTGSFTSHAPISVSSVHAVQVSGLRRPWL